MSIEEAGEALHQKVREAPWFTAVGIGKFKTEPCIFLYVKPQVRPAALELADGWMGYPVRVRKLGKLQPA